MFSHSHFDHVGDMTKLPNSTRLFVGPGTLANALPAFPTNNASQNLESDFQ
jgi:glyoxylase-like metal-dependent hydrolase (beta-lactamase superfamily II)